MRERKALLCQRSRCVFMSVVLLCIFSSFPSHVGAQTVLRLLAEPSPKDDTLYIPSDLREGIKVYAEITGKWKQLNWKFSGPGRFRNTGFGAIYLPPEELEESPCYVFIAATLISTKGRVFKESLKWTLMNPPPTPTPSPIPTITPSPTPSAGPTATMTPTRTPSPSPEATAVPSATPSPSPKATAVPSATPSPSPKPTALPSATPSPSPAPTAIPSVAPQATPATEATSVPSLSDLEKCLRAAKRYFDKKAYTTPKGENAFDEYKAVLTLDPTNRKAKQGIYNILRKYKFWADDEFKKKKFENARKAYERYFMVAEYLLETFEDQELTQDVQALKEKLQ